MNQVHVALERRFSGRSWVSSTEVEVMLREFDESGRYRALRRFDFVAANVCAGDSWIVVGVEVKVSRKDFLCEQEDPSKFGTLKRLTHVAYYAVPKGLVAKHELPTGAGLLELQPDGRLRESVKPAKNESADVSLVLAGLLRRSYTPSLQNTLLAIRNEFGLPAKSVTGFQDPDWWTSRLRQRLKSK